MSTKSSVTGTLGIAFALIGTLLVVFFDLRLIITAVLHPLRIIEWLILPLMGIVLVAWLIAQVRGPRSSDGSRIDRKAYAQKKLAAQVLESMQKKSTAELLEIQMLNDRSKWTDVAFDAASQVLKQRRNDLPGMVEACSELKQAGVIQYGNSAGS